MCSNKNLTPITNQITKTCTNCGKKKIIEKFSKLAKAKDGYQTQCNECRNDKQNVRELIKRDGKSEVHAWNESDKCVRCGLQRRMKANLKIVGRLYPEFLVDKNWTKEKQECIIELKTNIKIKYGK